METHLATVHPIDECALTCLAETYLDAGQSHRALECFTTLIDYGTPNPWHYNHRAAAWSDLLEFDKAAIDMSHAIALDTDNATYYWCRGGYLLSHEVRTHGRVTEDSKPDIINRILYDYKQSLECDPTRSAAWINLLEINVILRRWDDAIGHFGACHSYMNMPAFQVIRNFLGCLALVLAGDEILPDDSRYLDDMSIVVSPGIYRFSEIDALLNDLSAEGYDPPRLARAMEVRDRFLEHFDETPNNEY